MEKPHCISGTADKAFLATNFLQCQNGEVENGLCSPKLRLIANSNSSSVLFSTDKVDLSPFRTKTEKAQHSDNSSRISGGKCNLLEMAVTDIMVDAKMYKVENERKSASTCKEGDKHYCFEFDQICLETAKMENFKVSKTQDVCCDLSTPSNSISSIEKDVESEAATVEASRYESDDLESSTTHEEKEVHINTESIFQAATKSANSKPLKKASSYSVPMRSKTRVSDFPYLKKVHLSRSISINSLDMNKIPSWPPMKRNKVCNSDWNFSRFSRLEPVPESKSKRLFLNSLASLFDGVVTSKSTLGRKAGLGLFCTRKEGFPKATIFTEFVGWLVHREDAEKFRRERRASHIVAVDKGFLYIDGEKFPHFGIGGGSFANDGSEFLGGPGNNAEFYHWYDDQLGRKRVFLKATRDIAEGEEIFVSYNKQYWVDNFEEQIDNCPLAFKEKKLEQLKRKEREREKQRLRQRQEKTLHADTSATFATVAKQITLRKKNETSKSNEGSKRAKRARPVGAYIRFYLKKRKEIIQENPEMPYKLVDLTRLIASKWYSLSAEEKLYYEHQAQKEKEIWGRKKAAASRKTTEKVKAKYKSKLRRSTKGTPRKTTKMRRATKQHSSNFKYSGVKTSRNAATTSNIVDKCSSFKGCFHKESSNAQEWLDKMSMFHWDCSDDCSSGDEQRLAN